MPLSKILAHSCMIYTTSWKKTFCGYCLQAFSTKEILECHINDYFKINSKQMIKMSKKMEIIDSKITREKQNILVSEDNGKQNSDEPYTNKYQNMLLAVTVIN